MGDETKNNEQHQKDNTPAEKAEEQVSATPALTHEELERATGGVIHAGTPNPASR